MKIVLKEYTNENGRNRIMIMFTHHRATIFTSEIDSTKKNVLAAKLKIIDEYLQTFSPIYTKKEIVKTWAKIDEQFKDYFKTFDKRGGVREGAGRKIGSKKTTPKSERTKRFTQAITTDEKEYLSFCLEWYRVKIKQNPEELKRIMHVYRMYGVGAFLNESLDGKLRTITNK